MSLILSEYIEPFSDCLIKSVCKIFDVKVTTTHCCSLAKYDPFRNERKLVIVLRGCIYSITHIAAANIPRLPHLVPT